MQAQFKMGSLGRLSFYLGIEVQQHENGGISLNQSHYAQRILDSTGMMDCNACATPMEERLKLSRDSTAPPVDTAEYPRLIRSLRYLVNTRPDLAFSVGFMSRFMEQPTSKHMTAVKRILRYIAGTISFGCHYKRRTGEVEARLIGYNDSDHAGVLFFLGKSLVSWQSLKQRIVALSSW